MERLTNEAIKVDASVDGMIGSFVDLANMKPKLLDVILNGPTLISVSKNVLRSIIRQLYSALAAYEDTGLEPEEITAMQHTLDEYHKVADPLLRAQADGRLVVPPCKVGDRLYEVTGRKTISVYKVRAIRVELFGLFIEWDIVEGFVWQSLSGINAGEIGKTVFLTREEAEKALKTKEG